MGRSVTGHRPCSGCGWRPALPVLFVGLLAAYLLAGCMLIGPDYPDLPVEQPNLARLPAGVQPARTPADHAVRIAQEVTGVSQQPAGVGRRLHAESGQTAWVVMFITNREGRPCGPAPLPGQEQGVCVTRIAGAVIDDGSGALIYSFEMGGEIWPGD